MNQENKMLRIRNIRKTYGSMLALQDVSLEFAEEGIYGLFGRNGAGKTTLLNIIASRIFANSGSVEWSREGVEQNAETLVDKICYMPEKDYFPGWMKVGKLLKTAQNLFPNFDSDYADKLCKIFDLNTRQKVQQLSRGYQSILRIVIGLASNAPITIFDEPVLGLDAVARDRFYQELIEAYSNNPRLFIVSTHFIEESADLFNEAVIIHQGRIMRQESVSALLSNVFYVSGNSERVDDFTKEFQVLGTQTINSMKTAVVEGRLEAQATVPGLKFSPVTVQKLFIHMTGSPGQEEINHE